MPEARAVFLDRDGTLVEDPGFLGDAAQVRLLPGVAAAIRQLNDADLRAIVVTNQSGIARGLYSLDAYFATERRVNELLLSEGARLDAHYFCPHLPEISGPCDCRKPATLLYRQAGERFGIDLAASWWIGDRLRDLEPGTTLGGRGILVETGAGPEYVTEAHRLGFPVVPDLLSAVRFILARTGPALGSQPR
ncbi:MAG: HAD family hydrolase [Gemmatimonadota bacterium]